MRRIYKTIIGETVFLNNETGYCKRLEGTPWYIKDLNHTSGYFLRIGNTFKEFPAACFENTAIASKEFDFSNVKEQINQFNQEVNYAKANSSNSWRSIE